MVSFQSIRSAISQNTHAAFQVTALRVRPSPIVESFKLPTIRLAPVPIPRAAAVAAATAAAPAAVTKPRPVSPVRSDGSRVENGGHRFQSLVTLPALPTALAVGEGLDGSESEQEMAPAPTRLRAPLPPSRSPTPPTPPPVSSAPRPTPASAPRPTPASAPRPTPASAPRPTPASAPEPQQVPEIRKRRMVDPICLGIEMTDAMYAIASHNVQQSIECEEARRLEARIGELYKEESGRSRGWVKTKLEAFFVPRAAVGARVAPKDAFAWEKIWTDKEASAILDFVCLAKGIRVAVWKESERAIGLWPAADSSKGDKTPPIIHVGNVGKSDIPTAITEGWRLLAPLSVENGLEKLSVDELDGLAEKMGITIPSGKKTEKVRALASARMTMRIE